MSFDYTTGNPDNLVGGQPARMADIQGPFTDLRTYLNSLAHGAPSGTALPTFPSVGDTFIWTPSAAGIGVANQPAWHLLWNGSQWLPAGGGAAYTNRFPAWTYVPSGLNDLQPWNPGFPITIPRTGDWRVTVSPFTSRIYDSGSGTSDLEVCILKGTVSQLTIAKQTFIGAFDGGEFAFDDVIPLNVGEVLKVAMRITGGVAQSIVNNSMGSNVGTRFYLLPAAI